MDLNHAPETPRTLRAGHRATVTLGTAFTVVLLGLVNEATVAADVPLVPGRMIEHVACRRDPTQTYTLYLPSAFTPARKWPLLFVFDPRGRGTAAAEVFREAAEAFGWIVASSDNTASDGPWEPNGRALSAMWPDLPDRVPIDEARIYAAGFSGTVAVAWRLGQSTGKLAGIIGSGSRVAPDQAKTAGAPAYFGAAGWRDFNYLPTRDFDAMLERLGVARRLEFFDGEHEWLPPSLAREAIRWLEVVAMQQRRRSASPEEIAALFADERRAATALETSGSLVSAERRFATAARTFDGLVEPETLGEVKARARAIGALPAFARARRDERRWDEWEARAVSDAGRRLVTLYSDDTTPATRLAALELQVPDLRARAVRDTYEGRAASRVLAWAFTQASFYMWRDLIDRGQWQRAVFFQQLALEIQPDAPVALYRLALSHLAGGRRDDALAALARAVTHGFPANRLAADPALGPLRDDPRFQALVAR